MRTNAGGPGRSWSFGEFPRRCAWLQQFTLARLVGAVSCYQPVTVGGRELTAGDRQCRERWGLIAPLLAAAGVGSLLDLGCAEGFFVRQAARDMGCLAVGVDADIRRVTIASTAAFLDRIAGAAFLQDSISAELIDRLPAFDAVIFLSVLHHIIVDHGIEYAARLVTGIREKTGKILIFDMGQSDETAHDWSRALPDMGADAGRWIAEFLRGCGFSRAEQVGETEAYQGLSRRLLFAAYP